MGTPLDKDSVMECVRHGIRRPAFICQHLRLGHGIGFNRTDQLIDPELPFQNEWCDECDKVLAREGEWNDVSEGFAKPRQHGDLPHAQGGREVRARRSVRARATGEFLRS